MNVPSQRELASEVLDTEIKALEALRDSLDGSFDKAIDLIVNTKGYVIVTGVGKSGHIGRKLAATFASTGTPSFFVHPTEASHGDLGMLHDGSVVIAISNSGETRELRDVLVYAKREKLPVIGITAREQSLLGRNSTVNLLLPPAQEACPNRLAPTSSTTMTLAMGDALAVAAMRVRGFTAEDFGMRHPGGSLGRRLQTVHEWIDAQAAAPNPTISEDTPFVEVLHTISEGRCGAVSVVDADHRLRGLITDGDVRRAVETEEEPRRLTAGQMANATPLTTQKHERMGEVVEVFERERISQLIVVEDDKPVAIIHIKDLMQEGYL